MAIEKTSYPKDKIKILLLENISQKAIDNLQQAGYTNIKAFSGALSEPELIKEIKDVHMIGIRSKTHITENVLKHASKLQAIGCFCIGTNQVDLKNAAVHGVTVFNAPYSNTRSVAELVIGSSIMLIRKIIDKNNAAHNGKWLKEAKGSFELRGKTMGIIGYGNIGTQVSVLSEALGMHVIYYDELTKLPLGNAVPAKTMKDVLKKADIISMHVPDLPGTRNLMDAAAIKHIKKGSILINYARGEVVEIEALADAIKKGDVGGAAIDVFPVEPEKNGDEFLSALQGLPNVILTPHIGGSTQEAQENIGVDVSMKLVNFMDSGITYGSHTVPPINLPKLDGAHRILHIHKNVPGVLSEINTLLSDAKVNILGQYLSTNNEIGYVVLDVDTKLSKSATTLLKDVKGTMKVRLLY